MKIKIRPLTRKQRGSAVVQNSVPVQMLIACFFSSIAGVVLMAVTAHFLLMGVFIGIIVSIVFTTWLLTANKISVETACLVPTLLLCFVYTPLSWLTFDGLLGCTPYLSILFIVVIALTYYRRFQVVLLSLYAALILGLIVYWFLTWQGERDMERIVNILAAYFLTASISVLIVEGVKRKNRELNRHIMDLSMHDDLTGLLNRRAIERVFDEMEYAYQSGKYEYALVMLDIDHFKKINDLYGHHLGDSVLKSLAECINKCIRAGDYAFRMGGDEFLLILFNVDQETVNRISNRIRDALGEIHEYDFSITVSGGYAMRREHSDPTSLLELADRRMYEDKKSRGFVESADKI